MDKEMAEAINRAIAQYLKDNGATLILLASKLGITTATLSNKQTGRTDWKWSEILTMCELFGVTPNELAGLAVA